MADLNDEQRERMEAALAELQEHAIPVEVQLRDTQAAVESLRRQHRVVSLELAVVTNEKEKLAARLKSARLQV